MMAEEQGAQKFIVLAEVQLQCRLAWPIILNQLLTYSFVIVSCMFVGHLGELELSSASIASSFAVVTCFSVMVGLATALETLCGQAYGAKRYHLLGLNLQSSVIVTFAFTIPILILWVYVEEIFVALGQDPEISRLAALYMRWMIPGIFNAAFTQPIQKYLQTQSLVLPVMINSAIAAALHPFVCYTFIFVLGFGFQGGAMATTFSYYVLSILHLGYVCYSGKCAQCWGGWAIREAFGSIWMYLSLALPSLVMICFEFWSFELLVLAAGLLPKPSLELSMLSVSLNSANLLDMIPLGICVAASIRVSNELGANRPNAARLAMKVAVGLAVFNSCVVIVTLMLARNIWGQAFTNVTEVVNYLAQITPFLALLLFMDSIQVVLQGVVRGCGRQAIGATINLTSYYIIGIPTCLFLGFKLHLNGKGLLMGLLFAIFLQMTILSILNFSTNWERVSQKAQERLHKAPPNHEPLLPSYSTNQQESP